LDGLTLPPSLFRSAFFSSQRISREREKEDGEEDEEDEEGRIIHEKTAASRSRRGDFVSSSFCLSFSPTQVGKSWKEAFCRFSAFDILGEPSREVMHEEKRSRAFLFFKESRAMRAINRSLRDKTLKHFSRKFYLELGVYCPSYVGRYKRLR